MKVSEWLWWTFIYILPKKALSRLIGKLARRAWSRKLVPLYARLYRIDTEEAEKPIDAYGNLLAFFTRRLKCDARPMDGRPERLVSPVDGKVSACGPITGNCLLQAKGYVYTLEELLGDRERAVYFEGGSFVTLYLSPRDYHRIHVPISSYVEQLRYIPGYLYPVNDRAVRLIKRLFVRNERLITYLRTSYGTLALVKVGATNVGSIRVGYDETVQTNVRRARPFSRNYVPPIPVEKGKELGYFEFGSTVILLFPPGAATLLPNVKPGQRVRVGEGVAQMKSEGEA